MAGDRRLESRVLYRHGRLPPPARIRPGRAVVVVDMCSRGALVEGPWRFRPGSRVEFLVQPGSEALQVGARVLRCAVARLDRFEPVRYRAALTFDRPIPFDHPGDLLEGYGVTRQRGLPPAPG